MLACVCQPVDPSSVFRKPNGGGSGGGGSGGSNTSTRTAPRHATTRSKLTLANGIVITKEPGRKVANNDVVSVKKPVVKTIDGKRTKCGLIKNPLLLQNKPNSLESSSNTSSVSSDDDKVTIVSVKERVKTLEGSRVGGQSKLPPQSECASASNKPDIIEVVSKPQTPLTQNVDENKLPGDGVHLSLHELRTMACRQQTQIDSQQQMLAAKEQRLRWLKEQEVRQQRVHAESERLRRLRDRVDAQELKLRKLRALRGQVDNHKQNNISLTSDLDSIRALFNEKEKELSMAVAKVDELTRQLEELRRGRSAAAAAAARDPPPASALELDKLRRELMYRNKLNEQQNLRLSQQREALTARQEEMSAIDKRISELQERLHRKRMLNQQLANQISATSQKAAAYHQLVRLTGGSTDQTTPTSQNHCPNHHPSNNFPIVAHIQHHQQLQQQQHQPINRTSNQQQQQQQQQHASTNQQPNVGNNLLHQLATSYNNSATIASMFQRGNIAAVEPYNHIPAPQPRQPGQPASATQNNKGQQLELVGMNITAQAQNLPHLQQQQQMQQQSPNVNGSAKGSPLMGYQGQHSGLTDQQHQMNLQQQKSSSNHQLIKDNQPNQKVNHSTEDSTDDLLKQQQHLSKSDPKYQTLPYNTKFTVNLLTSTSKDPQTLHQQNNPGLHTNQMMLHSKESPNNSYPSANFNNQQSQLTMNQMKDSPTSVTKDQHGLNQSISYNQQQQQNSQHHQFNNHLLGKDVVDLNGNTSKNGKNVMAISNVLQMAEQISGGGLLKCAVASSGTGAVITTSGLYQQQQKLITTTSTSSLNNKLANIYQTSSTKVQPVEPQTLVHSNSPQIVQNSILNTINSSLNLNSSQISSTPLLSQSSAIVTSTNNNTPMPSGLPISNTQNTTSISNIANIISSINNNASIIPPSVLDKGLIGDKMIVSPKPALPPKPSPPQSFALNNNAIKLPPRLSQLQNQQMQLQQAIDQQRVPGEDQTRESSAITTNDPSPPPPPPLTQPPPDDDVTNPPSPPPKPQISTNNQPQQPSQIPTISTISSIIASSLSTNMPATKETSSQGAAVNVIKAKPLTLRKQLLQSEQPKLRTTSSKLNGLIANSVQHMKHQQTQQPVSGTSELTNGPNQLINAVDQLNDKLSSDDSSSVTSNSEIGSSSSNVANHQSNSGVKLRHTPIGGAKKGNLKNKDSTNGGSRRVSFDPLALLLDASLEGELELVKKTATQVANPSAANDEGITALHNAICAGHLDIVRFLVGYGCDVNAPDSDGWTPLHCAASCNNVAMVRFLVERGACIFAATLSDRETAAEKCEEDEEGFDGCSEYLYSVQEKLGILSNGAVYAVFDYVAQNPDELGFHAGQQMTVLRKGDETEREWWWCKLDDKEGYVPRNLLGLYPRVVPNNTEGASY